jgi:DNA polymerase-3 subunit beta
MNTLHIPFAALKAFAKIAPKHEIRYCLCGVLVETTPRHTYVVVTNGHYLVAHRHAIREEAADQDRHQIILPEDFCKSLKSKLAVVEAEYSPESRVCSIQLGGASASIVAIDGKFPDWRKVVPTQVSGELGQYHPDYLATVWHAIRDAEGYTKDGFMSCVQGNGKDKAAVMVYRNSVGVIMPVSDCERQPIPNWAETEPAQNAIAA